MVDGSRDPAINLQLTKLQVGLKDLVKVIVNGFDDCLAPFGVDAVDYTILATCFSAGPITIKDLGNLVPVDGGRISRVVTKLHDRNLVRKVRLRKDRRVVRVRMTEKGLALVPQLMRRVREFYTLLLTDISQEELTKCLAIAERMIAEEQS